MGATETERDGRCGSGYPISTNPYIINYNILFCCSSDMLNEVPASPARRSHPTRCHSSLSHDGAHTTMDAHLVLFIFKLLVVLSSRILLCIPIELNRYPSPSGTSSSLQADSLYPRSIPFYFCPQKGAKGTMVGAGKAKAGDKKKPVSRSARAGLQFPVGRIHRLLKVIIQLCYTCNCLMLFKIGHTAC